jgi:hypothetical protein
VPQSFDAAKSLPNYWHSAQVPNGAEFGTCLAVKASILGTPAKSITFNFVSATRNLARRMHYA